MPINPDAVGQESDPVSTSWTSKDALLYAVGIGAGTNELAFTTENTNGVEQQVFPTMAVVIGWGMGSAMRGIGSFNPAMLVHGEQRVTLHKPIPPEGSATLKSKLVGIYDKGKAAVVATETTATDEGDGTPLYTNYSSAFIRGEGGWGGDRGPSGPRNVPPEREPDHEITYQTSPDQALVYRLSGDRNPLHSDPSFAAMGGSDRPILHGLCTYGFTGRALLHALCGSDPARFQHVEGRFSSPVLPGDALSIKMWETGPGEAVFTTSKQDGTVVIDQGGLRYSA
jgi:acyl dehydratase